jgi:hypothetical protein
MVLASQDELAVQFGEVRDVLGDDRPLLRRSEKEKVPIGATVQLRALAGGPDIMTTTAELASDLRREVLVQHQPHPRMARSRSAADCSRSAMAACRDSTSSISSGKEA